MTGDPLCFKEYRVWMQIEETNSFFENHFFSEKSLEPIPSILQDLGGTFAGWTFGIPAPPVWGGFLMFTVASTKMVRRKDIIPIVTPPAPITCFFSIRAGMARAR